MDWGAGRIAAALQLEEPPKDEPVGHPGSERWVGGILRNVWPKLTEDQHREYRDFYWPESLIRGDLPWEVSATALELLAWLDTNGLRLRPPVRLVRWYWRVKQASPDMARRVHFEIAVMLARREEKGEPIGDRGVEWLMAYHQVPKVEGDDPLAERRKLYREAKERKDEPIPPCVLDPLSISISEDEPDLPFWIDTFSASTGATQVRRLQTERENSRLIEEHNHNLPEREMEEGE
jgi:hypothetical protein